MVAATSSFSTAVKDTGVNLKVERVEDVYTKSVNCEGHKCYLLSALAYADNSHSFEDVKAMVESGRLQFWPGPASAIVTEIVEFPRFKAIHFFLAGGNLVELEAMYPLIEKWGQEQGCDRATLAGRPGWTRSFLTRREGWRQTQVVLEKIF